MKMSMNEKTINIAIQVLPQSSKKESYDLVDDAIKVIENSGFNYKVCPFETVVECTLKQGLKLVEDIHKACGDAGTEKMMTYIKIQSNYSEDVTILDKMEKYE